MDYTQLLLFVTNVLFVVSLGWYLITNLQWYNYSLNRVISKHHKPWWHLFYFIFPFMVYYGMYSLGWASFFSIYFYFAALPALFVWHKKLDKPLVLTWRVRRFLILLIFLTLFQNFLCTVKGACEVYGVFMPLLVATLGSMLVEKFLFLSFMKEAKRKLKNMNELKIVAITGSYGKTSIKNFVYQILRHHTATYMTPRSVNTLAGIVKDINIDLPSDTKIYICEAGARQKGDIYEIAQLLNHHVAVVGKIGPAHIEYFKSLENIARTKLELMQSKNLEKAFIHVSATKETHEKVEFFGSDIKNLEANLEGLKFTLELNEENVAFETSVLGNFQAMNIEVAVKVALYLGMKTQEIQKAVKGLESVEHRLQRIDAGGKIILDDGFNGNLDGMKEGINLCSMHKGRKVIVTPGLVESSDELNLELIEAINKVFDIVIITGSLNTQLFNQHIQVDKKIMLSDKSKLTQILGQFTASGDVVLFANDAPNFI
ncbi:UDP-N-acetylmuramoyl-tripeptide--D-alanyl-D-alanine ligase [Sulfurimonas sp. MAG313]|nr:UDP-N-acetylmuramoyl-tripeptide--D-alanyl-D-alanine ligase [Sulfurimonas sp. MAG313]MDF1880281.1 UDP-N-acetylmuramoyl-tripeptide--D-alanyl-D-alanine ligase [Sulfurimonas sp. MAG313]